MAAAWTMSAALPAPPPGAPPLPTDGRPALLDTLASEACGGTVPDGGAASSSPTGGGWPAGSGPAATARTEKGTAALRRRRRAGVKPQRWRGAWQDAVVTGCRQVGRSVAAAKAGTEGEGDRAMRLKSVNTMGLRRKRDRVDGLGKKRRGGPESTRSKASAVRGEAGRLFGLARRGREQPDKY